MSKYGYYSYIMKLLDIVSGIYLPISKITGYALNINHPVGGDKAYMFRKHLGYTQDNYQFLLQQIEEKALTADAVELKPNQYGRIFQVDLEILGSESRAKRKS